MSVIAKKRRKFTTYYVETWWNGKPWREPAGRDKREAERLDAQRKREVKAGTFEPKKVETTIERTVLSYSVEWGASRTNTSAGDDRRNLARFTALPEFANLHLAEVRPRHVIGALTKLKNGTVSEKTLQNAYGTLRTMFRDAHIAELIVTNPCVLPRGFFSSEETKEREAYTRTEVTVLLGHHLIPEPIRVLIALCFLGGMREGEACGRRWRDLDQGPVPLWALDVGTQYGGRALKTKKRRVVPVHPDLQRILEAWGARGFAELTGHAPTPEDFIVPNISPRARVEHHTKSTFYKAFRRALAATDIPNKTLHSTRHTMITLGRRGHADKAVLSKVTHNAKGDIVDRYTHRDWLELCEAVMAIGTLSDARPSLHRMIGSPRETASLTEGDSTPMLAHNHGSTGAPRLQFPAPPLTKPGKTEHAAESAAVLTGSFYGAPDPNDPDAVAFEAAVAEVADHVRPAEIDRALRKTTRAYIVKAGAR